MHVCCQSFRDDTQKTNNAFSKRKKEEIMGERMRGEKRDGKN